MTDDLICIGAIAGAFGVAGEVRLKSFCSEPTDIVAYGPLLSQDGSREYHITLTAPLRAGLARGSKAFPPRNRPTPCAAPACMCPGTGCPACQTMSSTTLI
jgi:16S rRNA processing protein RimM